MTAGAPVIRIPRQVGWRPAERKAWLPPRQLTVSKWADLHRHLPRTTGPDGGRYRSSLVPYAIEWMDSLNDPWVRQVTLKAAAQVSKTETLNNIAGYLVSQDPCPVLMVVPRNTDLTYAFQRRIRPMIESTQVLTDELTGRKQDVKKREIAFRKSVFYLRAAQSAADLASLSARVVLVDELDKWPQWSGREASPLDLARERQKNWPNRILYAVSTPVSRTGALQLEWEDGDRRRFFVPCPHCQVLHVLEWRHLHWDKERITTPREMRRSKDAWFLCPHCSERIDEKHKRAMLAAGVWVPEGKDPIAWRDVESKSDRTSHRSYHIWTAYSPWVRWHEIVEAYLAGMQPGKNLQNFTNSWLAEVWEERVTQPSETMLAAAEVKGLRMGVVPAAVLVATGGVDVQQDSMYWSVYGWGINMECWLLGAGKVHSWEELTEKMLGPVWGPQGRGLRCVCIDARFRRAEVIDWARLHPRIVRPVIGVPREDPRITVPFRLDRHPLTGAPVGLLCWKVSVGLVKDEFAVLLDDPEKLHLPEDRPKDFDTQMVSEHKVKVRDGNREITRWVQRPGYQQNHYWDAGVYAVAGALLIKVDLLRTVKGEALAAPSRSSRRSLVPPARGGLPRTPQLGG